MIPRHRRRLPAGRGARLVLGGAAVLVASSLTPARVGAAPGPGSEARPARPALPGPVASPVAPDPALVTGLDGVIALSPPDTCIRVEVDGSTIYRHAADQPLVPASTQKLATAAVALDQLGADHRLETRVLAATAPTGGVVAGDLVLVGGGDPLLTTSAYAFVRRIGPDQPVTSLDGLADQVAATGLKRITGRVLGDESRYDQARTVASWPERYLRQGQIGPLSARAVDDGFNLAFPAPGDDAPVERERSADPAGDAARTFAELLRARGIQVDGAAGAGTAPVAATPIAVARSAPLGDLVREMLQTSDNGTAELLTKEVGHASGAGGSTAAGVAVIARRATELGFGGPATHPVDGSGLDPGNRATCDELVEVLDATGGVSGSLGAALPVAGRSGTLRDRFRGTPAEGRLRAKTGTLSTVTALAGFVELPDGGTATFAYVANGKPAEGDPHRGQDFLGVLLGQYATPCPEHGTAPLVAPLAPYAGDVGALAMFPLQTVLVPGAVLPLHVFEERYRKLVDRCLADDADFGVVLIDRGSEVGGGDQRSDIGTRARIVQAEQSPDGRWGILAVGTGRLRVRRWLADDPHPWADVEDWPDPMPATSDDLDGALAATGRRLRRVLALRAELGEVGAPATVDLDEADPVLASYRLAALAPVGPFDRHRLLAAPDVSSRLRELDALLDDEEVVSRARLGEA